MISDFSISISIRKDSYKLFQDTCTSLYGILFELYTKYELEVIVYYFAQEYLDVKKIPVPIVQ
jgi:hypothetical protein